MEMSTKNNDDFEGEINVFPSNQLFFFTKSKLGKQTEFLMIFEN